MHVELYCPNCQRRFAASPETSAAVLERASVEGPWSALGDGQTFEDSLAADLAERCPRCDTAANVNEESLGRLTLDLLGTW